MTLEKAKTLKAGTVLYEVDSCFGPHRRVLTEECGHIWNSDDPFVSKDHFIEGYGGIHGECFYPCYCFYESYEECRAHEMVPWF